MEDQAGGKPKVVVHGKATNTKGEEIDISAMIEKSGCSEVYYKLEDCLAENDRDWRKCQAVVQAWKECFEKKAKR